MVKHFTTSVFQFCPSCGSRNGKAATEKLFSCPDCDFRFYANPAAAVGGLLINGTGEVLLVERGKEPAKGKYNIPGGFVDPRESIEEALRREVEEEVGISLSEIEFLASFPNIYHYRGVTYHTVDMFFVCPIETEWDFVPNTEVVSVKHCAPHEIDLEELAFESTKQAVRAYLKILSKH